MNTKQFTQLKTSKLQQQSLLLVDCRKLLTTSLLKVVLTSLILFLSYSSSATTATGIAKEVTNSLTAVTLVQGNLTKSLKKAKRKIEYVETRLLEVKLLKILILNGEL